MLALLTTSFVSLALLAEASAPDPRVAPDSSRSVILIHPDGAGLAHWGLARILWKGPDGDLAWDRLPAVAVYRPHVRDSLAPESHSGATIHAYGVKVPQDSFGMDGSEIPRTPTGERISLMRRAMREGKAVGIVNSGTLAEPGTGCFLASVPSRGMTAEIARQLLEGRPNVILGGGERLFLPKGVEGVHGVGIREDGRNLVEEARAAGYRVVFRREELAALPADTTHLLGLFAADDTYNDMTEEKLAEGGLPAYAPDAPTVAEMARAALSVLSRDPDGFFLVVEEEGTDNFSNLRNAAGMLEAARRADEVIGLAEEFRQAQPQTLVLVAADSDAAAPQLVAMPERKGVIVPHQALPATLPGDTTPLDGVGGALTEPFLSAPDRAGARHAFAVAWATSRDGGDPVVVRASGPRSERVRGSLDNTDLYQIMFEALFGYAPTGSAAGSSQAP